MSAPPLGLLVITQAMAAVGQVFGARFGRVHHKSSALRSSISATTFSAVQAFVILLALELGAPQAWTGGQGPLWALGVAHPAIFLNSLNNGVYWLALVIVLREPWGLVLEVLAYLSCTLLLGPITQLAGLTQIPPLLPWRVVVVAIGAILCVLELSEKRSDAVMAWVGLGWVGKWWRTSVLRVPAGREGAAVERQRLVRGVGEESAVGVEMVAASTSASSTGAVTSPATTNSEVLDAPTTTASGASAQLSERVGEGGDGDEEKRGKEGDALSVGSGGSGESGEDDSSSAEADERDGSAEDGAGGAPAGGPIGSLRHNVLVFVAFVVLALTAGTGIVFTRYFEERMGFNMFGYTAADQILLPASTVPLALVASAWPSLANAIGEPDGSLGVTETLARTWSEVDFRTLIPYRTVMFAREFLFYVIATQYSDLANAYLEMTAIRVVFVWVAAVVVCSLLRGFVGISTKEMVSALHPLSLLSKLVGTAIVLSAAL
jgi:hypothetical protein